MQRLRGLDAALLAAENPTNYMHTLAVIVLDPSTVPGDYSFDTAREFIGRRLHLAAPLRRRVLEVPFGLHHPLWVEDPDFDLDRHLHHAALPSPGAEAELADFVSHVAEQHLDRSRPLWEMYVVEGLRDGRVALVVKLHHAMVDGIAGMAMLSALISFAPDAPDPEPGEWEPDAIPPPYRVLTDAMVERIRPRAVAAAVSGSAQALLGRVRRGGGEGAAGSHTSMFSAPTTPLEGPVTARRAIAFTRVALDTVKAIGHEVGATVNDVVVALVGGAARDYLAGLGALPDDPLVAIMPMSLHSGGEEANALSLTLVPTGSDIPDPVQRLERVHAVCGRAKSHARESSGGSLVLDWLDLSSPLVIGELARLYARVLVPFMPPVCNMVVSNVPGPPVPVYLAGAKVEALYPLGPVTDAMALNITVASCLGDLDIGITACPDKVPDVQAFADAIPKALAELAGAVGP